MRSALVYNYFWLRDKNSTEEMLKEAGKEQIAWKDKGKADTSTT